MPLNFTLTYNDGTNDVDDVTGDIARVGTSGEMLFEPVFTDGARLVSSDGATCPRQFWGYLDNGVLKTEADGDTDIRLWANDPAWGIDRFQYRVRADLTDAAGRKVPWAVFCFDAPTIDASRDLKDYIPYPGQKFGRGPGAKLVSGQVVGSDLILTNLDGSSFSVPIPNGTTVLVDNGDSTWSAIG